ncbi:MAG: 2Fe-2S iron-sulfur cluster-binding protein [Myxococcota bacterium]
MTPFNIRNRLKALLGMPPRKPAPTRPTETPATRYAVRFELPDGSSFEAKAKHGDTLARTSGRGPAPVNTGCSDYSCASCHVDVLAGGEHLSPADLTETKTREANGVPASHRLACQTQVLGPDVVVRIITVAGEA